MTISKSNLGNRECIQILVDFGWDLQTYSHTSEVIIFFKPNNMIINYHTLKPALQHKFPEMHQI